MSLQGSIETFAVADVLRLLAATSKSGRLTVQGPARSGTVWVDSARVLAAESPSTPHVQGPVDVLFQMLRFDKGSFRFEVDKYPPNPGEPLDIELALGEAESMLNEWRELEQHIPSTDAWIQLDDELPGDHVTLSAQEWRTLVAVGGGRTVAEIGDLLDAGELATYRHVSRVLDLGMVAITTRPATGGTTGTVPAAVAGTTPAPLAPPAIPTTWSPPAEPDAAEQEDATPSSNGISAPSANDGPTWIPSEPAPSWSSPDFGGFGPPPAAAPPPPPPVSTRPEAGLQQPPPIAPSPVTDHTYPSVDEVAGTAPDELTAPTGRSWEPPSAPGHPGGEPSRPRGEAGYPAVAPPMPPSVTPGPSDHRPSAPPPPPPTADNGLGPRNGPAVDTETRERTDTGTQTGEDDRPAGGDATAVDTAAAATDTPAEASTAEADARVEQGGGTAESPTSQADSGWLGSLADAIERADTPTDSGPATSLTSRFGSPGALPPPPAPPAPPVTWGSPASLLDGSTPERLAPPPPPPPPPLAVMPGPSGAAPSTEQAEDTASSTSTSGDEAGTESPENLEDIERQLFNLSPRAREAVKQSTGLFDTRGRR